MAGHTYAQSAGPDKHTNKRVTARQYTLFFRHKLCLSLFFRHKLCLSLFQLLSLTHITLAPLLPFFSVILFCTCIYFYRYFSFCKRFNQYSFQILTWQKCLLNVARISSPYSFMKDFYKLVIWFTFSSFLWIKYSNCPFQWFVSKSLCVVYSEEQYLLVHRNSNWMNMIKYRTSLCSFSKNNVEICLNDLNRFWKISRKPIWNPSYRL